MADKVEVKGRRPTIKDVALAAGVSPMTVSNVLNGHLQYVSAATKKRVEKEIGRLNYRRSAQARSLRVSQQRSIGMVIVDESPFFLADNFTCQVVAGLANVLNSADYTLTVQGMRVDQVANSMIMRNDEVGGFCAMLAGSPAERRTIADQLVALGQPLVIFQENFPVSDGDCCFVRQDDRSGGRFIADHLLARRVKTYVVIVPRQGWPAIENRLAGLREGLAVGGRSVKLTVVESASESFADVQAAIVQHLAHHPMPEAIIGANDPIATAAMLHLIDRGVRVPQDVRVVGFNGFEAHRYSQPRLTTVRSAPYAIGEEAGKAMLARLETGRFPQRDIVLPVVFEPNATT